MMDEEGPKAKPPRVASPPLGTWDVVELQSYIEELRAEIARAEASITRKQGHRQAADTFFRRSGAEP